MNFDLTVHEVRDILPPVHQNREISSMLSKPCFVTMLVMKVRSGKTNLISNLLLNSNFYGKDTKSNEFAFDLVYIISPTIRNDKSGAFFLDKSLEDYVFIHDNMETIDSFIENIIEEQMKYSPHDEDNLPPKVCLVLDDISGYLKRNSFISNLFSRYRHYNISIIVANQVIRGLPGIVRSMSTSVFLSSCYSTLEREKILDEFSDNYQRGWKHKKTTRMEQIWDWCCSEKFSYCYLKLDELKPRIFKIGAGGCLEIDWSNWHHLYEEEQIEEKPMKNIENNKNLLIKDNDQ